MFNLTFLREDSLVHDESEKSSNILPTAAAIPER